ncbi:hypothetical protein SAMN04487949_1887 [Halogranum gelatinilyticum]|uniref:Uncharacterized protein n=1 Tax=Halogranum gelatinilyticum TaxID=660521 RepID=A0A1G9TRX8_9EURY|nr:hypothetical protein SAMN04487949_1887 [Halogranum gelatinilyticum]
MATEALQRTIRRVTAVIVFQLSIIMQMLTEIEYMGLISILPLILGSVSVLYLLGSFSLSLDDHQSSENTSS